MLVEQNSWGRQGGIMVSQTAGVCREVFGWSKLLG